MKKLSIVFVIIILLISFSFFTYKVIYSRLGLALILSGGQSSETLTPLVYITHFVSKPAIMIEQIFLDFKGYRLGLDNNNVIESDISISGDLTRLDCYGYIWGRTTTAEEDRIIYKYADDLGISSSDVSTVCDKGDSTFIVSGDFTGSSADLFSTVYLYRNSEYTKVLEYKNIEVEYSYMNSVNYAYSEIYIAEDEVGNVFILLTEDKNNDTFIQPYNYDFSSTSILKVVKIPEVVYFCEYESEECKTIISGKMSNDDQPVVVNQSPIISGGNPEPGNPTYELPVEPAADLARKDLASKLSVDEKDIVIMQITETDWTDGCLGLGGPAESCLQAIVPGFKVELLAKGKTYFYRTDKTGGVMRAESE